jgi:hypothetical protein
VEGMDLLRPGDLVGLIDKAYPRSFEHMGVWLIGFCVDFRRRREVVD